MCVCVCVCLCFHNPPNTDIDYKIFNVRTDVNACDCTRVCTDTVRESALKVDSGRKSLAALGNRTCVGSVPVQCCNRLSYIPSHKHSNIPVISMELYSNPLCGFVLYTEGTQLVG